MVTSHDTNRTARIVRGGGEEAGESPRAKAARSVLEGAGFTIVAVDPTHWRIGDFSIWPETTMWRLPDGRLGSGGLRGLIEAVRLVQVKT